MVNFIWFTDKKCL